MTKARDIASAAPAPSTVSATELGYVDGVTSAIQTQLDAKTAKSTLTTTGDIYYASAANTPARLGIGSTGNVLTVASGIPSWATPAGGGKVLQVVRAQTTSETSTTSDTYVDTNLSATITPTANTSKILIFVSCNGLVRNTGNESNGIDLRLVKGSTEYAVFNNDLGYQNVSGTQLWMSSSANFLDTTTATSATTYKVQIASSVSGRSVSFSISANISSIVLMEIGA